MFPDAWDRIERERIISPDGKSWTRRSSDPMTIFLLAHYARTTAGQTADPNMRTPGAGGSATSIREEITRIREEKTNPYHIMLEKGGDQGAIAQDYLDGLYKKLYGTQEG